MPSGQPVPGGPPVQSIQGESPFESRAEEDPRDLSSKGETETLSVQRGPKASTAPIISKGGPNPSREVSSQ